MSLSKLHDKNKAVSAINIFNPAEGGTAISLQILKDELLKEHVTKTPAILICMSGEVIFENEKSESFYLKSGDYYNIEPLVKHWVKGIKDSQLVLVK